MVDTELSGEDEAVRLLTLGVPVVMVVPMKEESVSVVVDAKAEVRVLEKKGVLDGVY